MALTDTEAHKAKSTVKPYKLERLQRASFCGDACWGKLWRWKYRYDGKEKLMALGSYPDVSLSSARDRHTEARQLLAAGVDPMARRREAKAETQGRRETTFEATAERWMKHWKEDKSLRHVDSTRRRLDANILPSLGHLQIGEIQAPDVVAMVRAVEARGVRDVAKRALETTARFSDMP